MTWGNFLPGKILLKNLWKNVIEFQYTSHKNYRNINPSIYQVEKLARS